MIYQVEAIRGQETLFVALIFADSLTDCRQQAEQLADEKGVGQPSYFDITEPW